MQDNLFYRILLPGLALQSVLVGGGYASGRELVSFFLQSGDLGGLLGIAVVTLAFSFISMISFEIARRFKSYTYRHFFKRLLGSGWFVYEWVYYVLGVLILAVIGSAAGQMVADHLGINSNAGTVTLILAVCLLVALGSAAIERVLIGGSFLLYLVFGIFLVMYLSRYDCGLGMILSYGSIADSWLTSALKYVGYNVASVPLILFCVRHMRSRQDAMLAGALAGPLAMLPALACYIAMLAGTEAVVSALAPMDMMIKQLNAPWLQMSFYVVFFITFIETCTVFIHAINERISEAFRERERPMPKGLRAGLAMIVLLMSVYLASAVGLVGLIEGGYGTLTWMFVGIFVVPVLTRGVYLVFRPSAVNSYSR